MTHIDEFKLQQIAEGRGEYEPDIELHLARCATCRATLETYRFIGQALAQSHEETINPNFADRVMARIGAWEERKAYWKEWFWVWVGGTSGLVATVLATLMPASGLQVERLTEWAISIRERGALALEQITALVGGHFHLLVLALVIFLVFELIDKRLFRQLHTGTK